MKAIKAMLALAAAATVMLSCSLAAHAEGEDDNDNYAVTTTTGTSAEGRDGVVWTQITKDTTPADNDSVQVRIDVSSVENKKFTARLQVITKQSIAAFAGSVGYDPAHFRLVDSKLEKAVGGQINETKDDGKYSFSYAQPQGSSYSGNYITLSFETLTDDAKSDVLYLTVDSLTDTASQNLNFNKSDGIVNPSDAPKISLDVKTVRLAAFPRPYSFEELGYPDAINCEIENSDIAKYSEGGIVAITPGSVNASIILKDYSKQKIRIEVYNTNASGDEVIEGDNSKQENTEKPLIKAKTSVNIGVPILLIAALAFAVYIVTKTMNKQSASRRRPVHQGSYEPRYQQRPYRSQRTPSQTDYRPQLPRYPSDRYRDNRPR